MSKEFAPTDMQVNVIHLPHRTDRLHLLQRQFEEHKIVDYKIWDGIIDTNIPSRGISKAHKQIVRYAKENNLYEILIAEDDLLFTALGSFQFFLANKPKDYDIYLGSVYHGVIKKDNTVNDFSGLTFYIVNQRFFDTFLSMPEHIHLDRALQNQGKYVVCNPFAVIQRNGYSDNLKMNCNFDLFLKDRKLFGMEYPK